MHETSELEELIRSERLGLIGLLESLAPAQWETPSLCSAWTVQDVAAHLAFAPVLPPAEAVTSFVRARFRVNTFIATTAIRWAERGVPAIIEQLKRNAATGAKPTGLPAVAALGDAVVHSLDIRRPLGEVRVAPEAAYTRVLDFFGGPASRPPLSIVLRGSPNRRAAGLRLVADDLDWQRGDGPEVRGSADTLILALTGRPVGPGELTGPGAPDLYARL